MKPKRIGNTIIINTLRHISNFAAILLALWACALTFFFVGDDLYIQLNVDGYKPAVFTIKELKFYEAYTDNARVRPTHHFAYYFAYGEIDGNKERFGLTGFNKELIESQADLEKEFSVGQKLQVLYNPDIPKKFDIQIQYPDKDFKKVHKRRQMQMINKTYKPWAIAFSLCFLLGMLTKKKKGVVFVTLMSLSYMGFPWLIIIVRYYIL